MGRKLLQGGWLPLLEGGPTGDIEADLRVALLAMWGGGDRRPAVDFLIGSAVKKLGIVQVAGMTDHPISIAPLARWYTQLRSRTTKALLEAEFDDIRAMAAALPRKLTGKPQGNQPADWVFASPFTRGERPYLPESALMCHIRPAALAAGIEKIIGWHSFRHNLATLMVRTRRTAR